MLDYCTAGYLVSLELLNASLCVENPGRVDLAVVGEE